MQNQNSGTDSSANVIIFLIFFAFSFVMLWFLGKSWVVHGVFSLRVLEVDMLLPVFDLVNKAAALLHLPQLDVSALRDVKQDMLEAIPKDISFSQFLGMSVIVGEYFRYISMSVMLLMILFLLKFMRKGNFNTIYSMNKLRDEERKNWPQITPIHHLNLTKEDICKGPWAISMTPLEYCKKHKLIRKPESGGETSWELVKLPAYRLFTLQIGPLWKSANVLPIHLQALFVIFILCVKDKREQADQLIRQIAESSRSGKLDFSGVKEVVSQYGDCDLIQWVSSRHAYVSTVLATLIKIAREGGVLATAEFIWLKPLDRKIWYLLNSVGRQTAVVEAAGAFSHWKAELRIKHRLKVPVIKSAIVALEVAIAESLYVDKGDLWRTHNEG